MLDFDTIYKKINKLLSADDTQYENEFERPKNKIWKFWVVMAVVNIGLILVVVKLFTLQVINTNEIQGKAKRQHEKKEKLSAERGDIFDRNGRLLATTIRANSIAVDPSKIVKTDSIIDFLAYQFGMSREWLNKKIRTKRDRNNNKIEFVWIKRGVFPHLITFLKDLNDPGLRIIEEPKRYYPYGFLAAQIIGYTDIDNVGISGIELYKNELLEGRPGYIMVHRDALQKTRRSADLPHIPAVDGKSIKLTIDIELQSIVELELKRGIKSSDAMGGTVVALKPETGEVLAMASYPSFNPNVRSTIKPEFTKIKALTDEYAPGSTFKLITSAAALAEGFVSEDDSLKAYNGELVFNWGRIKDDHGLGKMTTFRDAVYKSSNIVMAMQAAKFEDAKWYKYVRNFGFGSKTDIDFPGEITGKLKTPKEFNNSSKYYMGHGYDLTSTPLQIVNAYAAIANGGTLMQPFLVKELVDDLDESENIVTQPVKIRQVIENDIASRITDLFIGVVEKGTGTRTRIDGLNIAGKTGTSQKLGKNKKYSKSDYIASFVGYFPAKKPQISMIVVVDRPRNSIYGGSNAAPIFKNITQRIISSKADISMSDTLLVAGDNDTILTPDIKGVSIEHARILLEEFDLELEDSEDYDDNDFVFYQFPKYGDRIAKENQVQYSKMRVNSIDSSSNKSKYKVIGMSARRALNILHKANVRVKLRGSGIVRKQIWDKGYSSCSLVCR